jgi:hypothetical protein
MYISVLNTDSGQSMYILYLPYDSVDLGPSRPKKKPSYVGEDPTSFGVGMELGFCFTVLLVFLNLSRDGYDGSRSQPLSHMFRNAASRMKTRVESIPKEVNVMQAYIKYIFDS